MYLKLKIFIILIFLVLVQLARSQNFTVSGYVEDLKTGERMIGAFVADSVQNKMVQTNNYGFFSLKLSVGKIILYSSFVGYKSDTRHISLHQDTMLLLKIDPVQEIKEVIIQASPYTHDINSNLGLTIIPVKQLTSIPAIGQADILKAIQLQPGIKGGIEGSAGIFVRGGGAGENLFLIDDVPVYNVSHLYGFFSTFNGSAIKDVKVIKGCFPAMYGGRASSVIDVRSRDGNNKSLKGEVSIGLISSSATLEGPLGNDKTTFMISGRRSYIDVFTEPLKKPGIVDSSFPDYYFYDLNASLAHTFSQRDRIFLTFYNGKDHIQNSKENSDISGNTEKLSENRNETSGWGNLIGSLRWNHTFTNSIFANTTFAYSNYDYFIDDQYHSLDQNLINNVNIQKTYSANYASNINDVIAKTDIDYSISDNQCLKFGAGNTFHTFKPGTNKYTVNDQELKEQTDTSYTNTTIQGYEPYLYLEDEIKAGQNLKIDAGIRFSGFVAGNSRYLYPEPRIAVNYKLMSGLVIKTGYSRMVQYMHLLSSSGVSMPTDTWVPASNGFKPLLSDQVNAGISYNRDHFVLITIELYQKWLKHTMDYSNGASLMTDVSPWYEKVEQGTGIARGIEFSAERQQGQLTGIITYTLSYADRKYADINNGQSFPFNYDRRHDFSISANYKISEKWDASTLWIYGTGYPASLPVEKYLPDLGIYSSESAFGGEIYYYPSRNNYRLPAYHRLDIGFHRKGTNRLGQYLLSIDIFNVYDRKNPDYMYLTGYRTKEIEYVSLLPIIPSISYTLKF